jgi:hypothetical protein
MPRVRSARIRTRFLRSLLVATASLLAAAPVAVAETAGPAAGQTVGQTGVRSLSRLELESVNDALASVGARVDPAPAGKTIGRIIVVNQDVFSKRDWYFQFFNIFHRTTRGYIIDRELLLKPGQPWDQALVEESTRNLQLPVSLVVGGRTLGVPEVSSIVVLLPVVSRLPGQVDLLVVTRDVWSLRFNSNFEYQGNALTLIQTSLSENNLFGWRKFLSVRFNRDQGTYNYGPDYFDPNIHGTRMVLRASSLFYTSRETGRYEGDAELVALHYPLYSLATKWGGGVDVVHQNVVFRGFRGNNLRLVHLPGTPDAEMLPYEYRRHVLSVDGSVVRSWGSAVIQRVTAGYLVDGRSSDVLPDFPGDALTAQKFLAQWAPITEQKSEPYLRYEMFTPRYLVIRDLNTFELRENRRLGPTLSLRIGQGLPELGADFRALSLAAAAGYANGPRGGDKSVSATAAARRLQDGGRWIDQVGNVTVYAASPIIGRLFRIVAGGQIDSQRANTTNTPFVLGGANGLRGYQVNEFIGTSALVAHIELRSMPVAIWSQRVGGALFYDVGDAAPSLAQLDLHNDVGLGVRWLIPQLNSTVIRFDWAVPLQAGPVTPAGIGRFSGSFEQVF